MRKVTFITVVALLAALFAAPAMAMTLTSSSFKDGRAIGMKYVCPAYDRWPEGQDISPQLTWGDLPAHTNYVAVIVEDKTASDFLHWAFEVPASQLSVDEDVDLAGVSGAKFSLSIVPTPTFANQKNGYRGPYPPTDGGTHEYVFTAYALRESTLDDANLSTSIAAIKANNLGKASITGKFPYDEPEEEVWKLAGTWNYTATIPETEVTFSGATVKLKADESGTIVANMTTGEKEGREYYDYMLMSYTGTVTVDSKSESYSGKDEKIELEKTLYTPGDDITYEKTVTASGQKITERLVCKQVEENKITGKLYFYLNGTKIAEGDVTATRPTGGSSSGGGCNAGVAAAMLVFCALPMFFRKKKITQKLHKKY